MNEKRYTPPPKHTPAGDRRPGGVTLTLQPVKRGKDGKATPPGVVNGKPVWFFKAGRKYGTPKTKRFLAPNWRASEVIAAKFADEGAREPESVPVEPTVADVCREFLAEKKGPDSGMRLSSYLELERDVTAHIIGPLGGLPFHEVVPKVVGEWKEVHCPLTLSNRTRAHRIGTFSSVCLFAVEQGYITASPIRSAHRVRVAKAGKVIGQIVGDERKAIALSEDQVRQILDALGNSDPAAVTAIAVTARCGFRLREVTHLRMQDLIVRPSGAVFLTVANDFPCTCPDACRINGRRLTKAGESRITPVAFDVAERLLAYVTQRIDRFGPDGWLFPVWDRGRGAHLRAGDIRSAQTLSKEFKRAAIKSGEPAAIFHDLRSTAKTRLLAEHGVATAVDFALGHRLPGQSSTYAQFADDLDMYYRALFPTWQPKLTIVSDASPIDARRTA